METLKFREKVCANCGKDFLSAVEHIYKENYKENTYWFCGWNCLCAFRRKHPEIGKRRFLK